jgi:hypothetical protein
VENIVGFRLVTLIAAVHYFYMRDVWVAIYTYRLPMHRLAYHGDLCL